MAAVPFYYYLIPNFQLVVKGVALSQDVSARIESIQVDDYLDSPSMFSFVITATEDQVSRIPWLDEPGTFSLGDPVVVRLGYDTLSTVMEGEITAVEVEFTAASLPRMTVRGYDRRHRLQRGRKTRTFLNMKDSDIVRDIVRPLGLIPRVEDSKVVHPYIMQTEQTDWEFLQSRAKQINYEVLALGKELHFRSPRQASTLADPLVLGKLLSEFHPRVSSSGQVTKVVVHGWDVSKKAVVSATANAGSEQVVAGVGQQASLVVKRAFGEAIQTVSIPACTLAEAQSVATAQLSVTAMDLLQADAICAGETRLRAGCYVKIEGVGRRFNGVYYISSASHRFDEEGYTTHLHCRRGGL